MKKTKLGAGIFWYWNATPSVGGIRRQLKSISEAGFSCVYLHPMPDGFHKSNFLQGMTCSYLGKKYFELAHRMLDECRKLGLTMMLYDEGGWPSGGVLDKLVKIHPEQKACFLCRTEKGWEEIRDDFPDLFDRKTTEIFIQMVYEKYFQEFGSEFGKTIRGIFTDEPFFRCPVGGDRVRLLKGLPERCRKEFHCDFERDLLPYLWKDTETLPEADHARRKYLHLVSELYAENYSGVLSKWCARHHLDFEGHFNHEEEFFVSGDHGELLEYLAPMQVPGIDAIWQQIFPGKPCHYPRFASSAAIRSNRQEALCECFNVYGYGLTTSQMHWIANTLFVQGINRILPMPYLYSDRGKRKVCCSTDFSPRIPQWRAMSELTRFWKIVAQFDTGAAEPPVWVLARTEHPGSCWPIREESLLADTAMTRLLDALDAAAVPWRFASVNDLQGPRCPEAVVGLGQMAEYEVQALEAARRKGAMICHGWDRKLQKFSCVKLASETTRCRVLPCRRPEGEALLVFNPTEKDTEFRFTGEGVWSELPADPVLPELYPLTVSGKQVSLTLPPGALRILLKGKATPMPVRYRQTPLPLAWQVTAVEKMQMSATGPTVFRPMAVNARLTPDGCWPELEFSGILTLEAELESAGAESGFLVFDRLLHAGELSVNGKVSCLRAFAPWAFPVTLKAGKNRLKLKLFSGAGNEWRRCFREELEPRTWVNSYAPRIKEYRIDDARTGIGSGTFFFRQK